MRWVGNGAYTEQMGKAYKILVIKSDMKSQAQMTGKY